MKNIKIGAIGLGRLGYHHAKTASGCLGTELYAVSDSTPAALERGVNDFGVKGYADYMDMVNNPEVNAVLVNTPTNSHYEVLKNVIPTKKPVFCEKPITLNMDEAEEIVDLVRKNKSFLMVGYNRRFDPGYMAAKKLIDEGKLGEVIYLHETNRDPAGPPEAFAPTSGGIFCDMGIHDFDVMSWLVGEPITEIYAKGAVYKYDFLKPLNDVDYAQVLLTFKGGAMGMVEISRDGNGVYDGRCEIVGKNQTVHVGTTRQTPITVIGNRTRTEDMSDWVLERFAESYVNEMQTFVDCVQKDKPSPVDENAGLMGLKYALTATKAFNENKPQTL